MMATTRCSPRMSSRRSASIPSIRFIFRRAARDTKIAAGHFRARKIPKDTMVLAANLSAMFDPLKIEAPESFRTDRPWGEYILWGYGMHGCFGAYINRAVLPAILKPLFRSRACAAPPARPAKSKRTEPNFPRISWWNGRQASSA